MIDAAPQAFYISGANQDIVTLYFSNAPKGSVLVKKVSASDNAPLSDVEFLVTTSDGAVVGDANGKFVTDSTGSFLISGIDPGTTLVIRETRAKDGYLLDDAPQTVQVKEGQTVTVEFRNQPMGNLIIHKLSSKDKTPLEGVQFKITYADGTYLPDEGGKLSSNGLYWTNAEGQIVLSGITGTVVVTEVESIPGYTLSLIHIFQIKHIETGETRTEQTRIGVAFFDQLAPGGWEVREAAGIEGWIADTDTVQTVAVAAGEESSATIVNKELPGLRITKYERGTMTLMPNVSFEIFRDAESLGIFQTDEFGQILLTDCAPGTYRAEERDTGCLLYTSIAGHNRGVRDDFGDLHTLEPGDTITWTTKLGTRTYEVVSVQKVKETDTRGTAATTDNRLTLFTCVRDQRAYRWQVQAVK